MNNTTQQNKSAYSSSRRIVSREIKFRAWDTITSLMVYEIQGKPENHKNTTAFIKWDFTKFLDSDFINVMQYTGLKDKTRDLDNPNGVEIYEGDILKIYLKYPKLTVKERGGKDKTRIMTSYPKGELKVVEWGDFGKQGVGFNVANNLKVVQYEVIGNIYQNKDLLK